ncbi:MFS transporter [Gordonia sp. CPCC 205333]|uniref:MFS transporter n=1 Tax=Gordonia sp. CPCC 205333 TaxID=3140790 RepID=UPI003AF3B686
MRAATRLRTTALGAALLVFLTAELFPVGAQSDLATGLHTTPAQVALLLSAYAVVAGAATLPLLAVSRRFDQRIVLVTCLLVLGASQVGFAFAAGITSAATWRTLAALVHGIVWSQATVVAVRLTTPDRVARANAAVFLGSTLGLVAGAPVTAALAHAVGWRATALSIGVAATLCAAMLWAALPPMPAHPQIRRGRMRVSGRDGGAIAMVAGVTLLVVTGHYVSYAFLEPLLVRSGLGQGRVAPMLAAYGVAGLLGVWLAGRHLDSHPARVRYGFLIALVLALSGVVLPSTSAVAVVVWGCAAAAIPVVLNTAAIRSTAHHADVASGVYVVAYQIGIAAGSALGAGIVGTVGLSVLPVVSISLVAAAAVLPIRHS